MAIKEQIQADSIKALKAGEKFIVDALRFLLAEIKNEEIVKRRLLTDEELVNLLRSQTKKRREAIELFAKGGRKDLVDKEQREIDLIKKYLPKSLSEEEIRKEVKTVVSTAQPTEKTNFGLLMGKLMGRLKGKVDGQTVSKILREEIGND